MAATTVRTPVRPATATRTEPHHLVEPSGRVTGFLTRTARRMTGKADAADFFDRWTPSEFSRIVGPLLLPGVPVYIHQTADTSRPGRGNGYLIRGGQLILESSGDDQEPNPARLQIRPGDVTGEVSFLARLPGAARPARHRDAVARVVLELPTILAPRLVRADVAVNGLPWSPIVSPGNLPGQLILDIPPLPGINTPSPDIVLRGTLSFGQGGEETTAHTPVDAGMADGAVGLAQLQAGRDYFTDTGRTILTGLASRLKAGEPADRLQAVMDFMAREVSFREGARQRTPVQVLREKMAGDADFAAGAAALLRALGVPCRVVHGHFYAAGDVIDHAWLEVRLPRESGSPAWILADPLLASLTEAPGRFSGPGDGRYIYPVGVRATTLGGEALGMEILFNPPVVEGASADSVAGAERVLAGFRGQALTALSSALPAVRPLQGVVQREFLFVAGSSYLLVSRVPERAVGELHEMRNPDHVFRVTPGEEDVEALWQVRVDSRNELVLELGVTDDAYALTSVEDRFVIRKLAELAERLRGALFKGQTLPVMLDMTWYRNPNTDELQKVTLRISSFVMVHYLDRVLSFCREESLLTPGETARIRPLYTAAGGWNAYNLLEMIQGRLRFHAGTSHSSPEPKP